MQILSRLVTSSVSQQASLQSGRLAASLVLVDGRIRAVVAEWEMAEATKTVREMPTGMS